MRDNKKDKAMYTIENPRENPRFMAALIRGHLRLISVGLQPPRGVRKIDILKKASRITGKAYARGQYKQAIEDINAIYPPPEPVED
jgi:hypothetical protein